MSLDYTGQEISTQVDGWLDAQRVLAAASHTLRELWQDGRFDSVVFTGCGSTHYLALTAACLFQKSTGVITRAAPSSELLLHPKMVYGHGRTLLVAISRSGSTTETIRAANQFVKQARGAVIVISCYADKPLNRFATVNLTALSGQEQSVAQTRSFSSMLVMAEALSIAVAGGELNGAFSAGASDFVNAMRTEALPYADSERFQRVYYLGSGPLYGLACEAMLKMKEMSLTSAEAFHPLEFRHGPKSMVDEQTLIVGLLNDDAFKTEMAVLEEMRALGATVISLSQRSDTDIVLERYQPTHSLVNNMPFVQWLAYLRAVNKGLNPDTPRHLDQVVIL